VSSVLKVDPVRLARAVLASPEDESRRAHQRRRRALFEDDGEAVIKDEINRIFSDPTVKQRVYGFARLAKSQNLAKRIIMELARPAYVVPPVRTVDPADEQERFSRLVTESVTDERMSHGLVMGLVENAAFVQDRYVARLGRVVTSVVPADCVAVVQDPDDPLLEMALIVDKPVLKTDGTRVLWRVYWDDEVKFQLDESGNVVPFAKGGPAVTPHGLGRIPFTAVHTVTRTGADYWNLTSNDDLFETQKAVSLLMLLALRKLKARGFRSLIVTGDLRNFPKGQLLDEEVPIQAPEGTQVTETAEEAAAKNYLEMIEALEMRAAANRGISRARMNQDKAGDDTGLMEQRGGTIQIMRPVELARFEVLKAISREYPDPARRLSPEATMAIDYGEIEHRVDPKEELEIWEARRRMGVASVLDQIKATNEEIKTDEGAWQELDRNLWAEAEFVRRRRALNIPEDMTAQEPGQDPRLNGAMETPVREGLMSRDEAREQARGATAAAATTTTTTENEV